MKPFSLGVFALLAIGAAHRTARAAPAPQWQFSAGVNYSTGDYGLSTDTRILAVPLSARVTLGHWKFRVSAPILSINGPADVVAIDGDGGGGTGSGPGGGGEGGGETGPGGGPGEDAVHGAESGDDHGGEIQRRGTVTGLGDISLASTYSLDRIHRTAAYLDVTGRVSLPTGDRDTGLGTGGTDVTLEAELGGDWKRGGVFAGLGRRFLGQVSGLDRRSGWQTAAGGWINANPKTEVGAFYTWRAAPLAGEADPSEATAYVTRRLTRGLRVQVYASAGLSSASPDFGTGVSFIFRQQGRR